MYNAQQMQRGCSITVVYFVYCPTIGHITTQAVLSSNHSKVTKSHRKEVCIWHYYISKRSGFSWYFTRIDRFVCKSPHTFQVCIVDAEKHHSSSSESNSAGGNASQSISLSSSSLHSFPIYWCPITVIFVVVIYVVLKTIRTLIRLPDDTFYGFYGEHGVCGTDVPHTKTREP